ncbi:hypothetical protein HCU64_14150 [Methylobacterium sp. C25]|uniref:hypothetical protein n=1 Tax=Methylobacterium sp. C25 TaxID=2721622 RepID=UPI001F1B9B2F|nr:hypothetical protein [Methylobacterium sp. C25]MCE4224902.1 hypothetical protein [Methylobacterium sp. C25]
MSTHRTIPWAPEPEREEPREGSILRLAEHAIGLWRAAQDVRDPILLEALRPLVVHVARALARDIMADAEDGTAH